MEKTILTYSEIRSWKECRAQHDFRYRKLLTAKGNDASYFRRGHFVHAYIERMYREVSTNKETIDEMMAILELDWNEAAIQSGEFGVCAEELAVEFAVVKGMILGYYHYYFLNEKWDGVLAEREIVLDVPEGGKFAAKIDAVVLEGGRYWIHDLKTVQSLSDSDHKLLKIDDQFSHYCLVAGLRFNREFSGGIRTFIRTPSIGQTKKETLQEYCERVVHDYQSRPGFYMSRIQVERSAEQIEEYRQYLDQIYREITTCTFVFRTPSKIGCSLCDYLDVCTESKPEIRSAMIATDFFVRKRRHSELSLAVA